MKKHTDLVVGGRSNVRDLWAKDNLTDNESGHITFNISCGVPMSKDQMTAFRFLVGVRGSAPLAIRKAVHKIGVRAK